MPFRRRNKPPKSVKAVLVSSVVVILANVWQMSESRHPWKLVNIVTMAASVFALGVSIWRAKRANGNP